MKKIAFLSVGFGVLSAFSTATRLSEVRTLDDGVIMLRFEDGFVHHDEGKPGSTMYQGHESIATDRLEIFGKPLDIEAAVKTANYRIQSTNDPAFKNALSPVKCFRKTKVSGTAWKWPEPDLTYEHTIFIQLPAALKQGKSYRLSINPSTNSDLAQATITFDIFKSPTEALHVNLIGANPDFTAMKSADLYAWMGDGGARDYSSAVGQKVMLYNVNSGKTETVGSVKFWKPKGTDYGTWNLTQSDVWNCDFSSFKGTGKFRLAVEGIGCSPDFEIKRDVYYEPFKTSVRGFYYMRIGEPLTKDLTPRQPRMIPGKEGFQVYMTTMSPWHPDWKTLPGDPWDVKDWSKYVEPGKPTNPNAYGGHSDALDWDRHLGHISIIWDLLLPYVMSNGKGGEDNLGIRESGNGIPDVIDEAQNEVDFWLRLRDTRGGYATGLNNPDVTHKVMYQGAAKPYMAWASAANAAMLADAFRIAKRPELCKKYVAAAEEAWRIANGLNLDENYDIGNGRTRGRDHKLLAAACLYNVTGDKKYEAEIVAETVIKTGSSNTEEVGKYNQMWGTAAYLMCDKYKWQPISNPELIANMKASIIQEALAKNVVPSETRPSRRSADEAFGWFQSIQEVQKACVAHAVASDPLVKERLLRALILEADWGLGRNPMNMVQMTGLGSRHPDYIYASGRNDGIPECHPGQTPYMNSEPWGTDFMANPRYYASRGYPEWKQWPHGEALWRAPYCYSNNEFTPQQAMRGKMCLLAYLHTLGSAK
jgi:endoglucanase